MFLFQARRSQDASIDIQRVYRGFAARNDKKRRDYAATKIQVGGIASSLDGIAEECSMMPMGAVVDHCLSCYSSFVFCSPNGGRL